MFATVVHRILVAGVIAALMIVASPARSQAEPLVLPGWDLFQTVSGTQFRGIPFVGVPLVSHNFTGVGVRSTFQTDTIVRRSNSVTAPSGTTGLVVEALQLRSLAPVPAAGDFLFITLQSIRGGTLSTGAMTIGFGPEGTPHGTFSSFFDVFFDVRLGALDGTILESGSESFRATADWTHVPPDRAVQIRGVNTFLNGEDRLNDFFTIGVVDHDALNATHPVETAAVPEPASLLLVGSGLAGILVRARARAAKK